MIKPLLHRLSQFYSTDDNVIYWKELDALKPYDKLEIGKGVISYKVPMLNGSMLFATEATPTEKIKIPEIINHQHDCKEIIFVQRGEVEYKGKIYRVGDQIVIYPYVSHSFKFHTKSFIWVHFVNPVTKKKREFN